MELRKEFEDVIVYMMSESGAMGPSGTLTCLKKNGESFTLDYLSDRSLWEEIKKNFPDINGCKFNGPMKHEQPSIEEIAIGKISDEGTVINPGWKHIYLDVGNHLVCKEEYYSELRRMFDGIRNCEITFDWIQILNKGNFIQRLSEIEEEYYKQKNERNL